MKKLRRRIIWIYFPVNLSIIGQYQRKYSSLINKYKTDKYRNDYFCRVSNRNLNLLTWEDKQIILLILQSKILNWYHSNILDPVMDGTEVIICRRFYFHGIREAIQKEVSNFDTCQHTKQSNKTIKSPARVSE